CRRMRETPRPWGSHRVYRACRAEQGWKSFSDGRIQDDRGTIRHQWKRLLHCEKETFHIDVEARVIELLTDLAQGGILRNTSIREDNIELALPPVYLGEEPTT